VSLIHATCSVHISLPYLIIVTVSGDSRTKTCGGSRYDTMSIIQLTFASLGLNSTSQRFLITHPYFYVTKSEICNNFNR